LNLALLLHRAAARGPDHPAVAQGTRILHSYGQLACRVSALGAAMRGKFNLESGDRVGLVMANTPAYVECLFACWHAGLAAVPINAKLHPLEIRAILEHSGARLCLATPGLANALSPHLTGLPNLISLLNLGTAEAPSADYRAMLETAPSKPAASVDDDLAWLFYTSGTTGQAKGAMLTHRNLRAMLLSYFVDVDRIAPHDSILHAAPMSHGSGLYILPHVAAGGLQIVPESGGFDAAEIFTLLKAHRGVTIFAAPTMLSRLVEHGDRAGCEPGGLKTVVYGGGPMYVEDLKRAAAQLGDRLVQIYGQGESPMTITSLTKADHARRDHPRFEARLGSVGQVQTVVEVKIGGDNGAPLPRGETGEILVRGDSVMPGYWRDPEASARALRDGWLHTGDIGVLDDDGYLTLIDRSKDLIISGGSNIYPREVEEVLLHHKSVLECAVVGHPHPDWGEEVIAFVVARPGESLDPAALDAVCLDRIARFKRPRAYRIVDSLPKNSYGKVLKTKLREQV